MHQADGAADRYREWVDAYSGPEFERLETALEGLLDRYAGDATRMRGAYRRAMRLEFDFRRGVGRRLRPPPPVAGPPPHPRAGLRLL